MGNCCSQDDEQKKEAIQRSAQIDRQIEQDSKKLKKECKILLLGTSTLSSRSPAPDLCGLGSSESGKSTIVKQMRIIHQDGFSYEAKITYREAIYSNLLESAQAVAAALHKFKVEPADPSNLVSSSSDSSALVGFQLYPIQPTLDQVLEYDLEAELQSENRPSPFFFPSQLAEAIHRLWQDPAVPEFVDNFGSQFYLMDSAS